MKKITLILFILFTSLLAQAQPDFYFKAAAGPNWQSSSDFLGANVSFDPRFIGTFALSAGVQVNSFFGSEIELSYRSANIDDIDRMPWFGDLSSSALMFNAVGRLPIIPGLYATLGGGVGFLSAELYDSDSDEYADGSSFASQFMVGLEMEFADNVNFYIEYKQIAAIDLELNGFDSVSGPFEEDLSYTNGSVLIGGKVTF